MKEGNLALMTRRIKIIFPIQNQLIAIIFPQILKANKRVHPRTLKQGLSLIIIHNEVIIKGLMK
ncbi:hypothetical protein D3C85_1653210 [compost metagenome]